MNGRYSLLLQEFAGQRHLAASDALQDLAQRFESASTSWQQVVVEPGWSGASAVAASAQFAVYRQRTATNSEQLLRAARAVESYNALIDFARDAYDALPSASIAQSGIDQLIAGASIVVQGLGHISNAQELYAVLQQLGSKREQAAQDAVERIQISVEELSAELSTSASTMVVSAPAAAASQGEKRRSLSEILREYQVRTDPDGMIDWLPSGLNRWIAESLGLLPDPSNVTAAEGELLDRLGPLALKNFHDAYENALVVSRERFPSPDGSANDNHTDAFRHAYWNVLLARYLGHDWARDFTTAHEGISWNPGAREAMDLYNNEVGREIAAEHPFASDSQIADQIEKALEDGRLVVIAPDGKSLEWSDRVPIGGAGNGDADAKALPGKDPKDLIRRSAS